jgi:hypothetical protein
MPNWLFILFVSVAILLFLFLFFLVADNAESLMKR